MKSLLEREAVEQNIAELNTMGVLLGNIARNTRECIPDHECPGVKHRSRL